MMITCRFIFFASIILPYVCAQLADYARQIAELDDDVQFQCALDNILKPRVVGSQGHKEVREFIIKELQSAGLEVELDQFVGRTPIFGNLTFTNIIARTNPNADTFLTLACHYDTKYFPDDPNFLGAVDSAVPCAILLNIVKSLEPYFANSRSKTGLMLVFFDGEEAFLNWNKYDSLYGARHLAKKWSSSRYKLQNSQKTIRNIDRIEMLVLVDLVGAAGSTFPNFYVRTQRHHTRLVNIERQLNKANLLERNDFMFYKKTTFNRIEDDHKPFYEENVPILHLISAPFPPQWHTPYDDGSNLHPPSIKNFIKVLRIFVYEYMFTNGNKINLRAIEEAY